MSASDPEPKRLNVVRHEGTGHPCLLVHGALGSRSYWNENLEALATVCQPIVVELWGHGLSPDPINEHDLTIDGYVKQFEDLRAELGINRWFTVGQSMGAALTLAYGLAHPDRVIAQVVTNSSSAFADPDEWIQRNTDMVRPMAERVEAEGVDGLRDTWVNPSRSRRIPERTRSVMEDEFGEHTAGGVAGSFAVTNRYLALGERVLEVSRPTMLTVGMLEERFLRLVPQAERIAGIELVEIDAAHADNAQNPGQWNAAVTEFLQRHRAS